MIFLKILEFVTPVLLMVFEAITKLLTKNNETEKEYRYISIGLIPVCWCYSFVNIFCPDGAIFSALLWIQEHGWVVVVYLMTAAVLPSIVACKERDNKTFEADEHYAISNLKFNVLGAAAALAIFGLAHGVIADFSCLKYFYVDDLMPIIASASVWIAVVYQLIERKKGRANELDHDAALKHLNQKLNLLHLFNVYFLIIVSVVYLVSYTIYCWTYQIKIVVDPVSVYVLISVALLFFYDLSQHKHQYLYVTCIICIPVILIASVYWMTWFTLNSETRFLQWIFVFAHSVLYMLCIFRRESIISIERYKVRKNSDQLRIKIGKWEIVLENYFPLVLPVIVCIIYAIIWKLPSSIDRMPEDEAYNYIDTLCADTDMDADEVIARSQEQDMYSQKDETYDIEAFLRFLSDELGAQLLDKKIIDEEGDIPTRQDLNNMQVTKPRDKNK